MSAPHEHGHEHGHKHAAPRQAGHKHRPGRPERAKDRKRLLWALLVTGVIAAAELTGGLWSGSLALISDAGHMLTDASALVIGLLALLISSRPADVKRTYGYYRAEILSALVNGVVLLGIAGVIVFEAYQRLWTPQPVKLEIAAVVATIGLVANLLALATLHRSHTMTVHAAFLHVLSDTLSSAGVLIGLGIIYLTGWTRVDAVLSVLISGAIVFGALRLLRDAVDVLLEAVPAHVDLAAVRELMSKVPGVLAVHDLHVWTISSGLYALSAHLVVSDSLVCQNDELLSAVKHELLDRFGIDHTTIQIESERYAHLGEVH